MRDVRHSSRSVVTLDRAQLVGLAFFAVLSGGLMFGLGYSAGKVPRAEAPKAEPPVLSQIDAEHALHQKMKEDKVDYTYFKALVAREDAPKVAKSNEPAKPVVTLEKPLAERAAEPAAKPEPVKAAPVEKAPVEKAPEKTFDAKLPPELEQKDPVFASAMAPTSPVEPAKPKTPEKAVASSKLGEFTIQVSAFKTESEADGYTNKLLQKGFQAFVTPSEVQGKGTWYRVRVGHFVSKTAAEMYKQKLDRDNVPGWIVKGD